MAEPTLFKVDVTHSVFPNPGNRKSYSASLTIGELKKKLYMIFGTEPQFMRLQLKQHGEVIATMDRDDATFGSYNPADGMEIHVEDVDPNSTIAELQDTTKVEKYTMSEDDYNKREGTYRQWKQQQQKAAADKKSEP